MRTAGARPRGRPSWLLPAIVVAVGATLAFVAPSLHVDLPPLAKLDDAQDVLWKSARTPTSSARSSRSWPVSFGVIILFKEKGEVEMDSLTVLRTYRIPIVLVMVMGVYCLVTTRNFIRVLIGLEIMTKSATLLIVVAGKAAGRIALAPIPRHHPRRHRGRRGLRGGGGIVLSVYRRTGSLDVRGIRNMKG